MATKQKAKAKTSAPNTVATTPALKSLLGLISVPMPATLTPDELLTRGSQVMDIARQHPDKLAHFIHQLELIANGKVIGRSAPLGKWPTNAEDVEIYRGQIIARAAVMADKPETKEDCFAMKLISQAAERAGIPLPTHLTAHTMGADAALRMSALTKKHLMF